MYDIPKYKGIHKTALFMPMDGIFELETVIETRNLFTLGVGM